MKTKTKTTATTFSEKERRFVQSIEMDEEDEEESVCVCVCLWRASSKKVKDKKVPVVAAINDDRGTKNVCVLVCATWKKNEKTRWGKIPADELTLWLIGRRRCCPLADDLAVFSVLPSSPFCYTSNSRIRFCWCLFQRVFGGQSVLSSSFCWLANWRVQRRGVSCVLLRRLQIGQIADWELQKERQDA